MTAAAANPDLRRHWRRVLVTRREAAVTETPADRGLMAVRRERALRAWLAIEYDRAQEAARRATGGGLLDQHKHCSAVARMCALGEVVQQLDRLAG